ncbi:uncharacterized protein LOC131666926 [Phymastichus coffea]|uniref:uncharacterized protein LOC131666926 n=1 Tax=Phymastichus coffea TaxID=108790 RepID=UPI00273B9338|nr:uncharacterized protein LOC131666926 [Phymastichus coffea]XP_058796008.1 uncharacterized protein LOC131666926 [Phymastichus coffea]
MLKHVSVSPWRGRADSVSLASSGGASSCGSPSPGHTPPPSRASSCASLAPLTALSSFVSPADQAPQQTTIKVYATCLRQDIEYKTLSITYETTCRQVVQKLLNKFRMRHRDPRLFYLTMEVTVRRANVRTELALDEDARPAALQFCHPRGDSKFSLKTRHGGLVKVYDSALMSGSKYKSLLISEKTTVDELIQMLLSCYNLNERVEQFSLYEVCETEEYQRKLHPDDSPLKVTQRWASADQRHLRIRRNPDYNPHRRRSMWSSDSSITLAMSRLQLQQSPHHHHHYFVPKSISNNNNNNNLLTCRHGHVHSHNHVHPHSDSNNNSSNNSNNGNKQQQQQQQQQLQLKSLPATPVATKHISTKSYADYKNYLFI